MGNNKTDIDCLKYLNMKHLTTRPLNTFRLLINRPLAAKNTTNSQSDLNLTVAKSHQPISCQL